MENDRQRALLGLDADDLIIAARSPLVPGVELPAGIIISALGAPYFLYLLARH